MMWVLCCSSAAAGPRATCRCATLSRGSALGLLTLDHLASPMHACTAVHTAHNDAAPLFADRRGHSWCGTMRAVSRCGCAVEAAFKAWHALLPAPSLQQPWQVFFSKHCPLLQWDLPLLQKILYTNGGRTRHDSDALHCGLAHFCLCLPSHASLSCGL